MLYCSKINFILVFHDQNSPRIQKYAFFGVRHVFLKTECQLYLHHTGSQEQSPYEYEFRSLLLNHSSILLNH